MLMEWVPLEIQKPVVLKTFIENSEILQDGNVTG